MGKSFVSFPQKSTAGTSFWLSVLAVACVKLVLLCVFSSDYQNRLFVPFVDHFVREGGNPWQYFHRLQVDMFPYPPFMLYVLSAFYLPVRLLEGAPQFALNFLFKLPTLISDLGIAWVFLKWFPDKRKEVFVFWFVFPVIAYAAYMHSQLDLVPMAILVLSIYFLTRRRPAISSILFGLALATKFHVAVALPLIVLYAAKKYRWKDAAWFVVVPPLIYLALACPYLFSDGYASMVLRNPKQMLVFDTVYDMGSLRVNLPVLAVLAVYLRFAAYRKINNDLLYSFLGILFSIFVFLVPPAPAWYIWLAPFLSIFLIRNDATHLRIAYLYVLLNALYLVFFIFFYIPDYPDLYMGGTALDFKIRDPKLQSLAYTCLEAALLAVVYALYKFGIKSNRIYRKEGNFLIGIGGDSAAGKSTLLADIGALLGEKMLMIEGDADHKWARGDERWNRFTHLDPKANFLHRQAEQLLFLKSGSGVERSEYDHGAGVFARPVKADPKEFIVISALHPFYLPIARKAIDLKIYMDTDERLRHEWKVLRDTEKRGYENREVRSQIENRAGDAKKYVHPQKGFADLVISYGGGPDRLKVKAVFSSNVHAEEIVERLLDLGLPVHWDYMDNLETQYISLDVPPLREAVIRIAEDLIPNLDEITGEKPQWLEGYRGFVQLIVLFILSRKLQEDGASADVNHRRSAGSFHEA